MTERIATGTYLIDAPCPRCGAVEEIVVSLSSVLTTPERDTPTVRVKLKGKPREHDCGQVHLSVQVATDDATDDGV